MTNADVRLTTTISAISNALKDGAGIGQGRKRMKLIDAIETIKEFIDSCESTASVLRTDDGKELIGDWGYFEEGLNEIERYANGRIHRMGEEVR